MRSSRIARLLVPGVVALAACVLPTDACGCTPLRSVVVVRGVLLDAAGRAVPDARLHFDGVRAPAAGPELPLYVGTTADATTDGAGAFRATAYSTFSPGLLALRAAVVRPGVADTVRLLVGQAPFRSERESPDSVRVTLRLP